MRSFKTAFPAEMLTPMQQGVMAYSYKDIPCLKCPFDIAIYMKLLWDLKPKTIIEIGSKFGGSAVFFADIAQIFGLETHVWSIDLEPPAIDDPRITFLRGDVNHLDETFAAHGLSECPHPWYVNEDSAHTYAGCLSALKVLAREMRSGDILAMEDGSLVELGLSERYQGGPNRAIEDFFEAEPDVFEIITELCDMFGRNATYNPNGYLRKT
jgi:cephalosporin hydroxylase